MNLLRAAGTLQQTATTLCITTFTVTTNMMHVQQTTDIALIIWLTLIFGQTLEEGDRANTSLQCSFIRRNGVQELYLCRILPPV